MSAVVPAVLAALAVLVALGPRPPSARGRVRALHRPGRRAARPRPWTRPPRVDHARTLDQLARRVRSGASLGSALQEVAPSGADALQVAARSHRRGLSVAAACTPLTDDPDRALALTGATLCLLAGTGGAAGRALDAAAAAVSERDAVAADVRAQAATAQLSAAVMVVLPLGFAAWSVASNAAARHFLVGSALGAVVAATGVALDVVGAWWMRRLVRSVLWT